MTKKHYYGTGRRKTSIARVFLHRGNGKIIVNCLPLEEYFGRKTSHMIVRQPFSLTNMSDKFDAEITVKAAAIAVKPARFALELHAQLSTMIKRHPLKAAPKML